MSSSFGPRWAGRLVLGALVGAGLFVAFSAPVVSQATANAGHQSAITVVSSDPDAHECPPTCA
jgi:hypothetical protein